MSWCRCAPCVSGARMRDRGAASGRPSIGCAPRPRSGSSSGYVWYFVFCIYLVFAPEGAVGDVGNTCFVFAPARAFALWRTSMRVFSLPRDTQQARVTRGRDAAQAGTENAHARGAQNAMCAPYATQMPVSAVPASVCSGASHQMYRRPASPAAGRHTKKALATPPSPPSRRAANAAATAMGPHLRPGARTRRMHSRMHSRIHSRMHSRISRRPGQRARGSAPREQRQPDRCAGRNNEGAARGGGRRPRPRAHAAAGREHVRRVLERGQRAQRRFRVRARLHLRVRACTSRAAGA